MEDTLDWESKFVPCYYSDRLLNKLIALNEKATNKIDLHIIKKAIYYARKYHEGQMRKSGEPYFSHPAEVAYMVSDYLWCTDAISASLLHDTIEDTKLTYEMIRELFNDVIANHVLDLTRIIWPDGTKMTAADTVEKLVSINKHDTLIIKLCDRMHNVQTIHAKSPEKMRKIIKETLEHFLVLAMYLEIPEAERELLQLCYKNLMPYLNYESQPFFGEYEIV